MLDIQPFTKIAWNSNTLKTQWEDKLARIRNLSVIAEYEMVKQGYRKANVYHMTPTQFDNQIEKITKDKLAFLPIQRSKAYNGYSHKHYPVDTLDSNCFVYGVVARDLDTAQEFVNASKKQDHIAQGLLLGYPECCCKAFQDSWVNKKSLDPCYEAAINTTGKMVDKQGVHVKIKPVINPLLRYFGIKIAPFFPCSFTCAEAEKVGEVWFNVFKSLSKEASADVQELLEQPISWSLDKGIIYIKTPLFKAVVNGYYCQSRKDVIANQ